MYKSIPTVDGLVLIFLVSLVVSATGQKLDDNTTTVAYSESTVAPTAITAPKLDETAPAITTTDASSVTPTTATAQTSTISTINSPSLTTLSSLSTTASIPPQEQIESTTLLPPRTEDPNTISSPITEKPTIIQQNSSTQVAPTESIILPSRAKLLSNEPRNSKLIDGIKSFVDLSLPLNDSTIHWPTNKGFKYESEVDGERQDSHGDTYYLRSDGFRTAAHAGTHLDAPVHFYKDGWTVDQIPLERLVDVPACVIDVSAQVKAMNNTYEFVRDDFINPITKESLVKPKSVVLVYTGMSQLYALGEKAYLGTDNKVISDMRVPGFSKEAAEYMVERGVYGVGVDSISADSSNNHGANGTYDPVAHTIFNKNNIYILENINSRLSEIIDPKLHMHLVITPLPIMNGSGSPVRLVAITVHNDCPQVNFASTSAFSPCVATTIALLYALFAFLMM